MTNHKDLLALCEKAIANKANLLLRVEEGEVQVARKLCLRVELAEARWEFIKAEPDGARHLLNLLKLGKGDQKDFDGMVDRLVESKAIKEADNG